MTFKEPHSTQENGQLRQLGDRDYDGFVTRNSARGLKYAGPFKGISASLARP